MQVDWGSDRASYVNNVLEQIQKSLSYVKPLTEEVLDLARKSRRARPRALRLKTEYFHFDNVNQSDFGDEVELVSLTENSSRMEPYEIRDIISRGMWTYFGQNDVSRQVWYATTAYYRVTDVNSGFFIFYYYEESKDTTPNGHPSYVRPGISFFSTRDLNRAFTHNLWYSLRKFPADEPAGFTPNDLFAAINNFMSLLTRGQTLILVGDNREYRWVLTDPNLPQITMTVVDSYTGTEVAERTLYYSLAVLQKDFERIIKKFTRHYESQ